MSSENFFPGPKSSFQDTVDMAVAVDLDGSNDPAIHGVDGRVVKSVVHTSTGVFTFVLYPGFPRIRSVIPTLQKPTAVNLEAEVVSVNASTKTIVVRTQKYVSADSGSDATVAAADPPAKSSNALVLGLRLLCDNTVNS